MTCPLCGGLLGCSPRLCEQCGTPIDADGTLEMLPEEPSEEALLLLKGRPIEFRPTVHKVHRRPFRVFESLRSRRSRVHSDRAAAYLSRLLSDERR